MADDVVNANWFPMEVAEVLKYETVVHQEIPGTMERTATTQSPPGNTRDYGMDSNHPESTRKYQGLSRNKLHEEITASVHCFSLANFWNHT